MKRVNKVLGWILAGWGAIRAGVDLLESIKATHQYALTIYQYRYLAVGLFSSKGLTISVIVIGSGLIFSDNIQRVVAGVLARKRDKELQSGPEIDGEVYRMATSPRVMEWELVKQMLKGSGRKDDPLVDTDILVEMYLVNKSSDRTRYIREMRLSAEIDGTRISFVRQPDLLAEEFNGKREYGIREAKDTFREDPEPLKQLAGELPLALAPEQPAEGWVRFMAKQINPDKITSGTVTLKVIDSVGTEYSIHKVPKDRERRGEIVLRRLGS